MLFSYSILTTYPTPSGNVTAETFTSQERVTVLAVAANASVGGFAYTFTLTNYNGTELRGENSTSASNETTIFDPYNNNSYLGNIGFSPVIYPDVQAGESARNMLIRETVTNSTVSYNSVQYVNATVTRGGGLINVNFTLLPFLGNLTASGSSLFILHYNSTTGVLVSSQEYSNIVPPFQKTLTYELLSFTRPTPRDLWPVLYVAGGIIAVIAAVQVLRRKTPTERKKDRIRKKFERRG